MIGMSLLDVIAKPARPEPEQCNAALIVSLTCEKTSQTLNQQAGAYKQHQRHSDLHNNQGSAKPGLAMAARNSGVLECGHQIEASRFERGGQAKHEPGDD